MPTGMMTGTASALTCVPALTPLARPRNMAISLLLPCRRVGPRPLTHGASDVPMEGKELVNIHHLEYPPLLP